MLEMRLCMSMHYYVSNVQFCVCWFRLFNFVHVVALGFHRFHS